MRRALLVALLAAFPARADAPSPTFGNPARFTEIGGPAVYAAACAGCHMPGGAGALGAASYPSLVQDGRLAAANYPLTRVLRGKGAMPPFGRSLSDAQIAAVVGFIRTSFGNQYEPGPSEADVAAAR